MHYAGDLSAQQSWDLMQNDDKAALLDVRTAAEWAFVGLADVSSLGRSPVLVEWQTYPSMHVNERFVSLVREQIATDQPVLCLCRSGARSAAAAGVLTQAGFDRAYNIAGGFEGDLNPSGHRGGVNGWKASGLPWRQN